MKNFINKELIDRLEKNLNGDSFTIPSGLSREEKRKFIMDCANGKVEPDKKKK